jgi:hypothetical protein
MSAGAGHQSEKDVITMGTEGGRYAQVKISVAPELASSFKTACTSANVSMAGKLSQFMAEFGGVVRQSAATPPPDYSTRRKRRTAVGRIIRELEQIRTAEENLVRNAPPNLQDAPVYETAGEYISVLEEAIGQLREMVP